MMKRLVRRGFIAMCCALAMVLLVTVVQAEPLYQDAQPEPGSDECIGCHEGLRTHWEAGAHAQAATNPEFQAAWQEQGSPEECLDCHTTRNVEDPDMAEGVACLTCHYPVVNDHPEQYMPTDVSSRLCGDCHLETFSQWETSMHAAEDLACSNCHSPHTTEIRAGNTQALCETCHDQETHNFAFTGHAKEGLLCTDCHLTVTDSAMGEGHGQRSHTFEVNLETCNQCHSEEMHSAVEDRPEGALKSEVACYRTDTELAEASAETAPAPVTDTPLPATPWVYALPAAFGLVFGALVAPWVEDWFRGRRGER